MPIAIDILNIVDFERKKNYEKNNVVLEQGLDPNLITIFQALWGYQLVLQWDFIIMIWKFFYLVFGNLLCLIKHEQVVSSKTYIIAASIDFSFPSFP